MQKTKFLSDMRARIQTFPTGGGGGVELLLEGLNSHFILFFIFCWAWSIHKTSANYISWRQGQRQQIKETAHINFRPRVVLKFGVARDDGLDARKCTLHIKLAQALWTSRTGFMRGSRIFVRRRGGGVEARRPENSLDNVFLSHQLILQFTEWIQWFYYRGEEGVQLLPGGGGVQRNP